MKLFDVNEKQRNKSENEKAKTKKKISGKHILIGIGCLVVFYFIMDALGLTYLAINDVLVEDITLYVNESSEIVYTVDPEDHEVEIVNVEYDISNKEIAQIVDGKVFGISEGETTLRVTVTDNYDNEIRSDGATITVKLTEAQKQAQAEAELEASRNTIELSEGVRIKDYCEQLINSVLKSPSTAEYPGSFLDPFEGWSMSKKNNLVTVASYVDAQNSFGAMIRSQFIIQIQMNDDGSGNATYVQFDGEILSGSYIEN